MNSECQHEWEFVTITHEYPVGYSGTGQSQEFAYFTCNTCLLMDKRAVPQPVNNPTKEQS